MNEAARSTAEWIASVRIATEPVIRPAATLSAISDVLEMIETAAARERLTVIGCTRSRSAMVREPLLERPCGAASVRDRVLLGIRHLGHRSGLAVGHEQRVVAEAAAAGRAGRDRAGRR